MSTFIFLKKILFAIFVGKNLVLLLKNILLLLVYAFVLIFHRKLFVRWSQWHGHRPRVIRCSKTSHSFSCFFFFSCFHWFLFLFYDSVFRFFKRSLFLFCNSCFFRPLFCFICLFFLTVFFPHLLKTLLASALPLLVSSCLFSFSLNTSFFSTSSSSIYFLNSFCKNLLLLFVHLLFPFSFSVFFCLFVSVCSLFCWTYFFVKIVLSESSSFKCVSFPSFFDSLFWSLCFDPFYFFLRNNHRCLSSFIFSTLFLFLVHFFFVLTLKTILFFGTFGFSFFVSVPEQQTISILFLFFLFFFLNSLCLQHFFLQSLFWISFFFPFFYISFFLLFINLILLLLLLFVSLCFRHHSLRFVISFSLYLFFLDLFFLHLCCF